MAVVFSGNITASTPSSGVVTLTFTDTSTGVTGLISRTLVITDPTGLVLQTINMGVTLTATYAVTSDQYLTFTETIVDGSGTTIGVKSYVCTAFYDYLYPTLIAAITCENDTYGQIFNLSKAELYKSAAITNGEFGLGVSANALIIQANFFLTTPYYA